MRRRLTVAPFLKSTSVAAVFAACPLLAQAAPVQTVFAAENALYGAGYSIGEADGWIDDELRAAVRQFQADRAGLSPTGELDSQTLAALGISGSHAELMGGNVVANRDAAREKLGLMVASAPAPTPKAKLKPRQVAAKPEPVARPKPEPVVAKVTKVSEPVSEPEPTSQPIKIETISRVSPRDEPAAASAAEETPEEAVNVASVSSPEADEADQKTVSIEADDGSQPTEPKGNIITKVFYFLFGWIG